MHKSNVFTTYNVISSNTVDPLMHKNTPHSQAKSTANFNLFST